MENMPASHPEHAHLRRGTFFLSVCCIFIISLVTLSLSIFWHHFFISWVLFLCQFSVILSFFVTIFYLLLMLWVSLASFCVSWVYFFYLYGDIVLTLWCILCLLGTDLFLSVYILRLLLIHFACLWCSFVPPKWAHLFIPSVINEPRYVQDFKWNTCLLHGLFHTLSVLI